MKTKLRLRKHTELGSGRAGIGAQDWRVQSSSSFFLPFSATFLLRMLMSFREERRGPVGVAGLRTGQARLQGLLMDCPSVLQGTLG